MGKQEQVVTRIIEIPKQGFLRNKEMAALFGRSPQTLMRWAKKGVIPMPCNYRGQFAGIIGPTTEKFWDAEEAWKAFDRLRGKVA